MLAHALAPPVIMMAFGSFLGGQPFFFSTCSSWATAAGVRAGFTKRKLWKNLRTSRLHCQDTTLRLCLLMWLPQDKWGVASPDGADWQVSHLIRESVQTTYNAQSWIGTDPSIIDFCICIFVTNPSIRFNIDFLPITVQKPASLHGNSRCQFHPLTLALHLSRSIF